MKLLLKQILAYSLLVIYLVIPSCRFPDGPIISFKNCYDRIPGDWTLTSYKVDGIDSIAELNDFFGNNCVVKVGVFDKSLGYTTWTITWGIPNVSQHFYAAGGNFNGIDGNDFTFDSVDPYTNTSFSFPYLYPLNPLDPGNPTPLPFASGAWAILKLTFYKLWFETDYNGHHYEMNLERS